MSLIHVQNLTFAYEGSYDNIFENVSFDIDTDWRLGFIGRNGKGKTTFLKLLMGELEYSGIISANTVFDYFPFVIKDKQQMALDIVEAIVPDFEYWRLSIELNKLEISDEVLYRPFETLSNGEQTKLLLAALFIQENHFLLIDEPTNHLDMNARLIVRDYLKEKSGFILVSHDRDFMDGCIDHVLSINRANIDIQKGNFSSWFENKQRQDNFELSENRRLKKEIGRLSSSASSAGRWAERIEATKIGHKKQLKFEKNAQSRDYVGEQSRRMQQRRKNLERRLNRAITEKKQLLKNIETTEDLKLSVLEYHSDRLVLCNNFCFGYENRCLCQNLSFEIHKGDRIALCGKNGCGKTTIIKLILDALSPGIKSAGKDLWQSGSFIVGSGIKISYVSQQTGHLHGNLSDYAREKNIDESLFKAILRKMDFERLQFEKKMENFSEGQKKKVLIAASLCEKAHLYIWDEPLNFIDIFSRMQIENLIEAYCPTMIFVEHDRRFMKKIATKIVDIDKYAN